MHTFQKLDPDVIFRQGFKMTTGNGKPIVVDKKPSFTQSSMSSPIVFDSANNNFHFPALNGSFIAVNSFYRINVFSVEGSIASFYECPQFFSPLYETNKGFDCLSNYCEVTVMCIDPITRQTFIYATPISYDNPKNVKILDLHNACKYVLFSGSVLRATQCSF